MIAVRLAVLFTEANKDIERALYVSRTLYTFHNLDVFRSGSDYVATSCLREQMVHAPSSSTTKAPLKKNQSNTNLQLKRTTFSN